VQAFFSRFTTPVFDSSTLTPHRLSAGILVAGWDEQSGPSVYNIPVGGGLFKQKWAIGGSGSAFIYGYCDATWKPDMSKEETMDFVRNALSLAMSRDGSSGGCIRMAVITQDEVQRVFVRLWALITLRTCLKCCVARSQTLSYQTSMEGRWVRRKQE